MEASPDRSPALGNEPVAYTSKVSDWRAIQLWKGNNGIQRLTKLAGRAPVQVMQSTNGRYNGSLHQRSSQTLPFREVLQALKEAEHKGDRAQPGHHLYLAQCPLWAAGQQRAPLAPLLEDIETPDLLQDVEVQQINLWLSTRSTRSSLHYDPHSNLLCVVSGLKTVVLYHPRETPNVYPLPLWSQSANHSAVDDLHPDLQQHPRWPSAQDTFQVAHVMAGGAVLIPEGWWHSVQSTPGTIAVNFWWQQPAKAGPLPEAYQLRRSLQTLLEERIDREVDALAAASPACLPAYVTSAGPKRSRSGPEDWGLLAALRTSLGWHSGQDAGRHEVTRLLAGMTLKTAVKALQMGMDAEPATYRAALEQGLQPIAAELLTRKLEEADQEAARHQDEGLAEALQHLYTTMYSLSTCSDTIFDKLVEQKEAFAKQCYERILLDHLGAQLAG